MSEPENSINEIEKSTNIEDLLEELRGWVYLRIDGNKGKIGRTNQKNPMNRAFKNSKYPHIRKTYNASECEKLIKKEFNKHFELVDGYETFKGNKIEMEYVFHSTVQKYNKGIKIKYNLINDTLKDEPIIIDNKNVDDDNNEIDKTIKNIIKDNNIKKIIQIIDKNKKGGGFTCHHCHKKFTAKMRLVDHLNRKYKCYDKKIINTKKYKYSFECDFCDKVFQRKARRREHINKNHEIELEIKTKYEKKMDNIIESKLDDKIKEILLK